MVNVITILLIILVLIFAGFSIIGYMSVQEIQLRSQKLEDLVTTKNCLVCCVKAEECANTETCRGRLDAKLCNRSKPVTSQHHLTYGRDETLKSIVKDVLAQYNYDQFSTDLNAKFEDPKKVKEGLDELDDLMVNSPKPRAHLAGVIHFNHTLLHRTGNENEYRNAYWDWRHNSRFSGVHNGMEYDQEEGALRVPRAGYYYVYLHTTFYTKSLSDEKQAKNETSRASLSHKVKKHNSDTSKSSHKLMTSKESRNCKYSNKKKIYRKPMVKTNLGFHTLDSNAVYKLERGDKLTVYYEMPDTVNVATLESESYFGVFML